MADTSVVECDGFVNVHSVDLDLAFDRSWTIAAGRVGLRKERDRLKADGLIHAESQFPVSLTLVVAILLLAIGVLAIVSMVYDVGPFG